MTHVHTNVVRHGSLIAAVGAIATVGAMLYCFPSGAPLGWLTALAVVGACTLALARHLCGASTANSMIIITAWTVLGVGFAVNSWWFTTAADASAQCPALLNDDAATVWQRMAEYRLGLAAGDVRSFGYAIVLCHIIPTWVPQLQAIILLNIACTLVSIVLIGAAAQRALAPGTPQADGTSAPHTARNIAGWAMAAMAINGYFMSSGVIIIKDAWSVLLMAVLIFVLADGRRSIVACRPARALIVPGIVLAADLGLCMLIRPQMLIFMALALGVWMVALPRSYRQWMLLLSAAAIGLYMYASSANLSGQLIRDGEDINFFMHYNPDRLNAYSLISPAYSNLDIPEKIVRLPFSLAVQFFTPLPMGFTRHIAFGPSTILAHVSYPWYAVGGLFLFFCFFCFRGAPSALKAMAIFAILAWVATAYPTGGTVSRYCLPWLPAVVAPAAWVVAAGRWRSKAFAIWAGAFTATVAIALVVIAVFVNHYSPQGWGG
ncbi:MAG: hypothetical protein K2M55_07985 [Muribaculaceae bacterium]|nr:hypothetical protein [Muribaculaceae bacterium]